MNNLLQSYKRLLLKHEALLSRLFIRDFFIKNTISEVYENVGQALSVVRMQIATFSSNGKEDLATNINFSGNLLQQSIRDLRAMCKSFYPDEDILNDEGRIEAFKSIIAILFQTAKPLIETKGKKKEMQPELKLIIFKMLLEMLITIKETEGELISLVISYEKIEVKYIINYKGKPVALAEEITGNHAEAKLSMQQRAQLINAKYNITQSKTGITRIELASPLKCVFYE